MNKNMALMELVGGPHDGESMVFLKDQDLELITQSFLSVYRYDEKDKKAHFIRRKVMLDGVEQEV